MAGMCYVTVMRRGFVLAVVSAALTTPAFAANPPVRFLICQPGGPDIRPEQQKVIDRLYRYIEKKTGLEAGRITGTYTNDHKTCLAELAKKPAVLFPSLPIFLENRRAYGLRPVAQLKLAGKVEDHFYILTRKADTYGIEDLGTKKLTGTHLASKRFIYDVLFEGKADADKVTLVPEKLGLRAIRSVVKGTADAVILDGSQYRALVGTRYEAKLRVLAAVGPLPTPPVTVLEGQYPRGFPEALGAALAAMRSDDTGREVLEMFHIEGFARPAQRAYASLEARFSASP